MCLLFFFSGYGHNRVLHFRTHPFPPRRPSGRVEAPNVPRNAVDLELTLQDGLLHLKPLRLGVAGGLVNADIRLDARHDRVTTDYDIRLSKFRLDRKSTRLNYSH